MSYILSFDQGTTSCRSIIFDRESRIVGTGQKELAQHYPRPGWVEHDPVEIWNTQIETAREALSQANLTAADIAALGITNQRETAVLWERVTGRPICKAIVWQDRRTSEFCSEVRSASGAAIRQKTGLEVDAYFSASKISWMLDNVADARAKAENGELAFGTIDSWLAWNLTAGRSHVTDVSNASRTMLFNIHSMSWDDELLGIFGIPCAILPDVRTSSGTLSRVESVPELKGIPISGIAGDQQAALFGQGCFDNGSAKNTYGTGCFMLQNTGNAPVASQNRLLTTVAWQIGGVTEYALEGSVFIGGAVVQWLRDSLGMIGSSSDVETLAAAAQDNGGVYFVPAFVGLGTPHWDQDARGLIIGLTRGTGREHIARAALESIAFQTAELLDAMKADSGVSLDELRVDGGAVDNDLLMQFQSDVLQLPVQRSQVSETTALGAAYLAGLAVGFWGSRAELSDHWQAGKRFEPHMNPGEAARLRDRWSDAVNRSLNWEK
jgi:glycerol kinase